MRIFFFLFFPFAFSVIGPSQRNSCAHCGRVAVIRLFALLPKKSSQVFSVSTVFSSLTFFPVSSTQPRLSIDNPHTHKKPPPALKKDSCFHHARLKQRKDPPDPDCCLSLHRFRACVYRHGLGRSARQSDVPEL